MIVTLFLFYSTPKSDDKVYEERDFIYCGALSLLVYALMTMLLLLDWPHKTYLTKISRESLGYFQDQGERL